MTSKAWDRGTGPSLLRGLRAPRRPTPSLAAVLWDMDGLLVDSEPIWTVAENELFARWGVVFTPAMKAAIVGTTLEVSVPTMIALGGSAASGEDVTSVKSWLLERMVALFGAGLPLRPGAGRLLAEVVAAGLPQALVSSSYRPLVDAVLSSLPGHPFSVSVAGDEVLAAKPDPEPYVVAARRLGVDPRSCVVLEDTVTGARAGSAAGARVLYCPSVEAAGAPEQEWWPVTSLLDVSLSGLRVWLAT